MRKIVVRSLREALYTCEDIIINNADIGISAYTIYSQVPIYHLITHINGIKITKQVEDDGILDVSMASIIQNGVGTIILSIENYNQTEIAGRSGVDYRIVIMNINKNDDVFSNLVLRYKQDIDILCNICMCEEEIDTSIYSQKFIDVLKRINCANMNIDRYIKNSAEYLSTVTKCQHCNFHMCIQCFIKFDKKGERCPQCKQQLDFLYTKKLKYSIG